MKKEASINRQERAMLAAFIWGHRLPTILISLHQDMRGRGSITHCCESHHPNLILLPCGQSVQLVRLQMWGHLGHLGIIVHHTLSIFQEIYLISSQDTILFVGNRWFPRHLDLMLINRPATYILRWCLWDLGE